MKYWLRALAVGLSTTVAALLVYQVPPTWEQAWQPILLGVQAALIQAFGNQVTRTR